MWVLTALMFLIELCSCSIKNRTVTIGLFTSDEATQVFIPLNNLISKHNYAERSVSFNLSTQASLGHNVVHSLKRVCNFISDDDSLIAVLSTGPVGLPPVAQSLLHSLQFPYIQSSWNFLDDYVPNELAVNLHPNPNSLATAFKVIVDGLQWKKFLLFYEHDGNISKLRHLLNVKSYNDQNVNNYIIVKKLNKSGNHRSLLKNVKDNGRVPIVLDCKPETLLSFFQQLQDLNLINYFPGYFLTSLDAHTVDLHDLIGNVNVTTIRIFDTEHSYVKEVIREWSDSELLAGRKINLSPYDLKTETVLVYDVVRILTERIRKLSRNDLPLKAISCQGSDKFEWGSYIISQIKANKTGPFITGPFRFDDLGRRQNYTIYVIEGIRNNTIATWNSLHPAKLQLLQDFRDKSDRILKNLQEEVITVSSKLERPFLMLTDDHKFEGYVVDLMEGIADINKFKFKIHLNVDGKNGEYNKATGKWDGLISDILDNTAQLAVSDLTVTPEREMYVDFSQPFMRSGISVLYKKVDVDIGIFDFLVPFSGKVWICTLTWLLSFSIALFFVARMAPGDWENPNQPYPTELKNLWTMKNCLWLAFASIMNQGPDDLPKGISSRMLSSMWWFFALIMINSYTASLAAYLTTNKMLVINNIEDLAKQNRIKYGCVRGGATESFLKQSNYSAYKRIYANMLLSNPTVFELNNRNGIKRTQTTKDGLYAFFMESATIEYAVEGNCDLNTVRKSINRREYGIAMPTDYPYRFAINDAILQLQEKGNLSVFRNRWWREKNKKPACKLTKTGDELTLKHVGGVFLVVGVGLVLSFLFGVGDFLWNVKKISVKQNVEFCTVFKLELLFALNVAATKKRNITKRIQSSPPVKIKNSETQLLRKSTSSLER